MNCNLGRNLWLRLIMVIAHHSYSIRPFAIYILIASLAFLVISLMILYYSVHNVNNLSEMDNDRVLIGSLSAYKEIAPTEDQFYPPCQRYLNTRKFSSTCMQLIPSDNLIPVLITGLGGSGTHKIAEKLIENGLQVRHEGIGYHGSVVRYVSRDF